MIGKCAKQEVIAIIENNGQYWIGSNYCLTAQDTCPRAGMPSGEGYELCKSVCGQCAHAEIDAVMSGPARSMRDGTLYLIGHRYVCEDCKRVLAAHGINTIVIGKLPEGWKV